MTTKDLKKHAGNVLYVVTLRKQRDKLEKEIADLEGKAERAERKGLKNTDYLLEIKTNKLSVLDEIIAKLEAKELELLKLLNDHADELTPLESIIIQMLYVQGLNWTQVMDELQTKPEYSSFCYERSSYMRAHRSALDKLQIEEE